MNFFNGWIQGIVVAVIITVIIEMILPEGNCKKYIKIILGMYVMFSIISPVIGKFTGGKLEVSSIINMDKYAKELGTYEETVKNRKLEYSNDENIQQIYIKKLKEDISNKLKEKGYITKNIELSIENDGSYSIKDITIYLKGKKKQEEKKDIVNEIKIVDISIGKKENNEVEQDTEKVSYTEKTEIIKNIAEIYGISEKKITIF